MQLLSQKHLVCWFKFRLGGIEIMKREESEKPLKMEENEKRDLQKPSFTTDLIRNVYQAICMNPKINYFQLEDNLGVIESSIHCAIG